MHKPLIPILLCLILTNTLLFSIDALAGKKQCKGYLEKLHNIQSQQRQGYSLKQGNKLEQRAEKARKKWWDCERGLTTPKKKSKKNKRAKVKNQKKVVKYSQRTLTQITPFETTKAVVIKGRFQGKQQQAWLDFYQQPEKCFRPKTTKVFAYCVENKRQQSELFKQQYLN